MRCAVLASADSWYLRDLRRAASGRHEVECVAFERIGATLDGSRHSLHSIAADHDGRHPPPLDWNDFDAVLVRTMPPGSLEQVVFDEFLQIEHRLELRERLENSHRKIRIRHANDSAPLAAEQRLDDDVAAESFKSGERVVGVLADPGARRVESGGLQACGRQVFVDRRLDRSRRIDDDSPLAFVTP